MGRVIEFYRPEPKPTEPSPDTTKIVKALFRKLSKKAETIEEAIVVCIDKEGQVATIGTLNNNADQAYVLLKALINLTQEDEEPEGA